MADLATAGAIGGFRRRHGGVGGFNVGWSDGGNGGDDGFISVTQSIPCSTQRGRWVVDFGAGKTLMILVVMAVDAKARKVERMAAGAGVGMGMGLQMPKRVRRG